MVAYLQTARQSSSGRYCACRCGNGGTLGCNEDLRNPGRVPGTLGTHASEARVAVGSLSQAWLRAGRCHAGLAAGAQRQPDWAKAKAEARRAREEAEEAGEVAAGVSPSVGGETRAPRSNSHFQSKCEE
jgi:hypothetical protein